MRRDRPGRCRRSARCRAHRDGANRVAARHRPPGIVAPEGRRQRRRRPGLDGAGCTLDPTNPVGPALRQPAQRLGEVGQEVLDVLESDRQPQHILGDADRQAFGWSDLGVGGAGRVGHERLGVAQIVGDLDQLQPVEHRERLGPVAADPKGDQRAAAAICRRASSCCGKLSRPG